MSDATKLAYLAGMIDGDGYITINRSVRAGKVYHAPQVGIAGTRREPHDLAASMFGGSVGAFKPKNPLHRVQYQWTRQGSAAVKVIRAIEPYLLVKVEHAWLALELWQHIEEGRSDDPFPWYGPHFDPARERDDMRDWMIDLNQSRNRVGKKASGRTLDGQLHDGSQHDRARANGRRLRSARGAPDRLAARFRRQHRQATARRPLVDREAD